MSKARGKDSNDIVLVNMPFGSPHCPSIGLSLLAAGLEPLGLAARVLYFNLRFADLIGLDSYSQFSEPSELSCYHAAGEWVFSSAVIEQSEEEVEAYLEQILRAPSPGDRPFLDPVSEQVIGTALRARAAVDGFIDQCVDDVLGRAPRLVGFSCVFEQRLASLALARRVKRHSQETVVVFGGPIVEGIQGLELVRRFDCVDAVVSGEGDLAFPEIVRRALDGRSLDGLEGVYTQAGSSSTGPIRDLVNAPLVTDMDGLPIVRYDDYFEQLAACGVRHAISPVLFVEGSRGCWWGEKHRCTFCAFGGASMHYRSKSGPRALAELRHVAASYPSFPISLTDNIVDVKYFDDVIPQLTSKPLGVEMACDMKANLRKDQIRALREAGITLVQLGIESLSTPILELMRKGIRAIECIQVLKWCRELGVQPDWNILWGFPDEPPAEYSRMARVIPHLTHLPPPEFFGRINVCRFSPCFEEAEQLGITGIAPSPAFAHIFPFDAGGVSNLATYFTYSYRNGERPDEYAAPVVEAIRRWKKHHRTSQLFFVNEGSRLLLWDGRPKPKDQLTVLSGVLRELYLACDRIRSRSSLERLVEEHGGSQPGDVEELLQSLIERGLMISEDGRYLALAIPVGEYQPGPAKMRLLRRAVADAARRKGLVALTARLADEEGLQSDWVGVEEIRAARVRAPWSSRRGRRRMGGQ